MIYKRILLPLDGSELAERALPHAIAQGQGFGAELVLLRVAEMIAHTRGEYLKHIAEQVQEESVQVETAVVEGRPSVAITWFAETSDIDMIVLCTRGRSGFSRWLMGSVADRVVRGATLPVLLVRASKESAGQRA